jgi:protein-L-isoaspartate(D-aspartate) O-methyltransferase
MVIPVGDAQNQALLRVRRDSGGFHEEEIGDCRFVKLLGKYGWRN